MRMNWLFLALLACDPDPGRPVAPKTCSPGFADPCESDLDCLDPATWQCLRGGGSYTTGGLA